MSYSINIDKSKYNEQGSSHIRMNREYLLNNQIASEFNTYLSFDIHRTFSDITTEKERADAIGRAGDDGQLQYQVGVLGAKSLFNRFGSVIIGGDPKSGDPTDAIGSGTSYDPLHSSELRISHNAPLIDTPENRLAMRDISRDCSIKNLVEDSKQGLLGRAIYSYSDFMYCKYLGRTSNNYLVTLRRFPTPVDDYISSAGSVETRNIRNSPNPGSTSGDKARISSSNPLPIGTMVTWMNTPGNNLEEILKYNVKMSYEEKKSQWQQADVNADSSSKALNALAALSDSTYRKQYAAGYAGGAINPYMEKFLPLGLGKNMDPPYSGMFGYVDSNRVYGPVDAIKKVYYRGEDGLDFDQSFKLTFDYELRSYNGINGKAAMLDLISNILQTTYSPGDFWGGGYRGGGAHQNNIFANLNIMKCNGGLSDFWNAFTQDASTITTKIGTAVEKNGGLLETAKKVLNSLGGMLAGGFLNKLGRPQRSGASSLLVNAPTGLWHVTIGNPYHPIMSLGNMVLTNTTITHYGPLGLDDFPTGIKVECELTRGIPRDLRGIQTIYMNGNDRIYATMGPEIFDLYTHAKLYRKENTTSAQLNQERQKIQAVSKEVMKITKKGQKTKKEKNGSTVPVQNIQSAEDMQKEQKQWQAIRDKLGDHLNTLQDFFGTNDIYSIYLASAEQEFGAYKAKKKKSN